MIVLHCRSLLKCLCDVCFFHLIKAMFHHFTLFSSGGHNSFMLPPLNLIYGSKDSSLQELSNEL